MLDIVHDHLDKVLGLYTLGTHFDDLKSAKDKYFNITGVGYKRGLNTSAIVCIAIGA